MSRVRWHQMTLCFAGSEYQVYHVNRKKSESPIDFVAESHGVTLKILSGGIILLDMYDMIDLIFQTLP